jgi:hypothetical protein
VKEGSQGIKIKGMKEGREGRKCRKEGRKEGRKEVIGGRE